MKSNFMTIGVRDFFWGLFYALIPALVPLGKSFSSGIFPSAELWKSQVMISIPIIVVYVVVHFFKNNRGEFGKQDK